LENYCKINEYDIQTFLREGGKIKDLINPIKFNKLYKEITNELGDIDNIDKQKQIKKCVAQ
jgi:hypothetical protein